MTYRVNHFQKYQNNGPGSLSYRTFRQPTSMQNKASAFYPVTGDINDTDYSRKKATVSNQGNSLICEWYRLFGPGKEDSLIEMDCVIPLQKLRELVTTCVHKQLPLRSICWRLFLNVLPMDMSHWCITLARERQRYAEIDCMVNPDLQVWQVPEDHPLSQESHSLWNRHFRANRIKRIIAQDVDRTFPKIEYFRDRCVHKAMVNVLFCYCENYGFQYRQGMHEILAPLFYVLNHDYSTVHQNQPQQDNQTKVNVSSILDYYLKSAIDPDYLEADAFSMFCVIMKTIQLWYISDENLQEEPKRFRLSSGQQVYRLSSHRNQKASQLNTITDSQNPSLERLFGPSSLVLPAKNPGTRYIDDVHNGLVRQLNENLHAHLEHLDIFPALFGIRWIRLLFGHEYALPDLLSIWDCIFAIGESFALVRFLYASMLVLLAPQLLTCNFSECINLLMHYPVNTSTITTVQHILRMALHLYKPNSYTLPIESRSVQHHSGTLPRMRRIHASTPSSTLLWQPAELAKDGEPEDIIQRPASAKLTRRGISKNLSLCTLALRSSLDVSIAANNTVAKPMNDDINEERIRKQGSDNGRTKLPRPSLTREIAETLRQALNIRPNQSLTPTISVLRNLQVKGWTGSTTDLHSDRSTPSTEPTNAHENDHISQQLTIIQNCNLRRLADALHGCATNIEAVLMDGLSKLNNQDCEDISGCTTTSDQNWQNVIELKQAKAQLDEAQHLVDETLLLINSIKISTAGCCKSMVSMVTRRQQQLSKNMPQGVNVPIKSQDPEAKITNGESEQPTYKYYSSVSPLTYDTGAGYGEEDELERLQRLGEPGSILVMKRFSSLDYGEEVDELDTYSS